MARVQVRDLSGPEGLQTQARGGSVQMAQAGDEGAAKAMQLARSLEGLQPGLQRLGQQIDQQTESEARAYAQSLTVEELGIQLKEGTVLPNQSPVFVGTLQHIWGENSRAMQERDLLAKMETGEIQFADTAELETHLVDMRNATLQGQSQFATAGYDKQFDQLKAKALGLATTINAREMAAQGEMQAQDRLTIALEAAKDSEPLEAAGTVLQQFDLLREAGLLNTPDQRKRALGGLLANAGKSGNQALVAALLDASTDGKGGPTVRAAIGETAALQATESARVVFQQAERERVDQDMAPFYDAASNGRLNEEKLRTFATDPANSKFVSSATVQSLINSNLAWGHRNATEQAKILQAAAHDDARNAALRDAFNLVKEGKGARIGEVKIPGRTPGSQPVTLSHKELKEEAFALWQKRTGADFTKTVIAAANNGVTLEPLKREIDAGSAQLATVTYSKPDPADPHGKREVTGKMNEQGQQALETFANLNAVNPHYAKELLGETTYRRMADLETLTRLGVGVHEGAALINEIDRKGYSGDQMSMKAKEVDKAVDNITGGGFWSFVTGGGYADSTANSQFVRDDIVRMSKFLLMGGMAPDAGSALRYAADKMKDNFVKVGGGVIPRQDLVSVPDGEDPAKWMVEYTDNLRTTLGTHHTSVDDVFLAPRRDGSFLLLEAGGGPVYNPQTGGVVRVTRQEIQRWTDEQREKGIGEIVARVQSQKGQIAKTTAAAHTAALAASAGLPEDPGAAAAARASVTSQRARRNQ